MESSMRANSTYWYALKIQNPHAPKEYVEEVMRRFYTLVKGK